MKLVQDINFNVSVNFSKKKKKVNLNSAKKKPQKTACHRKVIDWYKSDSKLEKKYVWSDYFFLINSKIWGHATDPTTW